jgi:TusA-related sulfurtransferase
MPVVKAGKEIKSLEPGQVLEVLATDRGSVADMPAWAADTGNELLGRFANEVVLLFLLRRRRK